MRTMRAVRLHDDGLRIEEVPAPQPAAGEALVRVHAAAITRDELTWPVDRLPAIPSYELSGVIAEVAPGVHGVAAGDEVYALTPFDHDGVAAEYAVVPARVLASKPRSLSHVENAALPLAGLSAWQGLFVHGELREGERVRVLGATGGVGHLAVQLARGRLAGPDEPCELVFDTVGGDLLTSAAGSAARVSPSPRRRRARRTSSSSRAGTNSPSLRAWRTPASYAPRSTPSSRSRRRSRPSLASPSAASVARWCSMSRTTEERGEAFRALHSGAPFVLPNPWDAGSARVLAALGFRALATTSSGFAFTLGRLDGGATLDEVVAHVDALARATELPLSVDLEHGHGSDPGLAITRVAEAGAVGASIEDWDGTRLYERQEAVERVAVAVAAARAVGFPFTLTARAENHLRGNPDLDDTIARLQAFAGAGADVLYAPGLTTLDEIRDVCAAVSKPVNVLARQHLTFAELAAAGVRRVSVGGALTWTAVNAFVDAAAAILDRGDFSQLGTSPPLGTWFPPR